jgi:hypothetical protein
VAGDVEAMQLALRKCWRQCIRSAWRLVQASQENGRRISEPNLLRYAEREWRCAVRKHERAIAMDQSVAGGLLRRALDVIRSW